MNLDHFGMDTITLSGPLETKLAAMRAGGFRQVMLMAPDIAGHPGGERPAVEQPRRAQRATRDSTNWSTRVRSSSDPSSARSSSSDSAFTCPASSSEAQSAVV